MFTTNGVEIVHNLRIWTADLQPCTVDLQAPPPGAAPRAGWFHGRTDTGSSVLIDSHRATITHPVTGSTPPVLGRCRWVATCDQAAVRMQPHRLMSPVPTCERCVRSFELP